MRGYRQRLLIDRAIQAAPSAVKLFIEGAGIQNIHTLADFNTFQNRIIHAATILQSVARMLITMRNISCVMVISPLLLRYPIVCDGLLLPTVIFREVMLKHVIDNTVRLQSCARGYRVRLRQQLLHVLVEEMVGSTQSVPSHHSTALQIKHLVAQQLNLAICTPEDILEYMDSISRSIVTLQAYTRGWRMRKKYRDRILVSVQIIQKAMKKYLQNLSIKLLEEYSTLLSDIPLLVSTGLISQDIGEGFRRNVPYLSISNFTILRSTCERLSCVLAHLRGVVVRLRLRTFNDVTKTPCIFKLLWYQASVYGQLPLPLLPLSSFIPY